MHSTANNQAAGIFMACPTPCRLICVKPARVSSSPYPIADSHSTGNDESACPNLSILVKSRPISLSPQYPSVSSGFDSKQGPTGDTSSPGGGSTPLCQTAAIRSLQFGGENSFCPEESEYGNMVPRHCSVAWPMPGQHGGHDEHASLALEIETTKTSFSTNLPSCRIST